MSFMSPSALDKVPGQEPIHYNSQSSQSNHANTSFSLLYRIEGYIYRSDGLTCDSPSMAYRVFEHRLTCKEIINYSSRETR